MAETPSKKGQPKQMAHAGSQVLLDETKSSVQEEKLLVNSRLEVDSRAGSSNQASNNAANTAVMKANSSHSKTRAAAFGGEFNTDKVDVVNSHAIVSPAVVTSKYNKLQAGGIIAQTTYSNEMISQPIKSMAEPNLPQQHQQQYQQQQHQQQQQTSKNLQEYSQRKRQLSNFQVKQRMSQSQINNANAANGNAGGANQRQGGRRGVANGVNQMDGLVNQQNYQHQAYLSRQNQNQQILTQSIGDTSNASYVFDGGSNHMQTRGAADQSLFRANLQQQDGANGSNIYSGGYVDNRSLSNESSIGSSMPKRNLIYRNVRNYNNLYENRSLVSKNIEMQDQMRLGGAQKLWTFNRQENFLPSIYGTPGHGQQSHFNYTNQSLYQGDISTQQSQMTHLKRVKRSVAEDGTQQAMLELRHSPISQSNMADKPGTHHGYQSTHYTGNMASTEPINKGNTTSNSFNQPYEVDSWSKANTMHAPFVPELSVSSTFRIDGQINLLKPILRRNCLHQRNNIVLQWKSFEILIFRLEYEQTNAQVGATKKITSRKLLNPVYVPMHELNYLLTLNPSQIELRVIKSLQLGQNSKQFIYVPSDQMANQNNQTNTSQTGQQNASDGFSRATSLNSPTRVKVDGQKPSVLSPMTHQSGKEPLSEVSPVRSVSNPPNLGNSAEGSFDQSFGRTQSSQTNLLPLEDKMPNEIVTSLYMQQANSDFVIIIKPPSIEYAISSKNFVFMKTLTREENSELIASRFLDWQSQAIRCLTKSNKFNELIAITNQGIPYKVHLARQQAQQFRVPKEPSNFLHRKSPLKRPAKTPQTTTDLDKKEKPSSPSEMQIYVLDHLTGLIKDYQSLSQYRESRFLAPKSGQLRGCFNQNGSFGQIQVRPFSVVIKGLDTDYEYRWQFQSSNWSKLVGFMQLQSMRRPNDPTQLVDKFCKLFMRSLHKAEKMNTNEVNFRAVGVLKSKKVQQEYEQGSNQYSYRLWSREKQINNKVNDLAQSNICQASKTTKKLSDLRNNGLAPSSSQDVAAEDNNAQQIPTQQTKDSIEQQRKRFVQDAKKALRSFLSLQKRSKMLQVPKQDIFANRNLQQEDGGGEDKVEMVRYLIEIEFPVCQIIYQGQTHSKPITEEDMVHLCSSQFFRWKNYLMTKHFRLELNIGQEKPLPRIVEDKRGEDDLISETDPRDKFPITDAEKPKLEQTRAQVTNWFGV